MKTNMMRKINKINIMKRYDEVLILGSITQAVIK